MPRVLLTAFEPYGPWRTNASWLTLVELTRDLPSEPQVTTRLYPVDYQIVRERIQRDLAGDYDFVVMTGQAPGRPRLELETVALNLAHPGGAEPVACLPLEPLGPAAYFTDLPAEAWAKQVCQAGIPAGVSRHAGTYLCNAALYFTLHSIATQQLHTRGIFVHLPLDSSQAAGQLEPIASQPAATSAQALRLILQSLPEPVHWT